MGRSKIEWSPYVHNIMHGCSPVSEGCVHCYAEPFARRLGSQGKGGYPKPPDHFKVTLRLERVYEVRRWVKPRIAFVCSMGDLFHPDVPFEFIAFAFQKFEEWSRVPLTAVVEDAKLEQAVAGYPVFSRLIDGVSSYFYKHLFLVLTKRPERMAEFYEYYRNEVCERWPHNIWPGISASTQLRFDERVQYLFKVPAPRFFFSGEPLLGPIDVSAWLPRRCDECNGTGEAPRFSTREGCTTDLSGPCPECNGRGYVYYDDPRVFSWLVFGAETGLKARPMHPNWARGLRDQGRAAGVPVLFKRWGPWVPESQAPDKLTYKTAQKALYLNVDGSTRPAMRGARWPSEVTIQKIGRNSGGRELDGKIINEFPVEINRVIR